MSNKMGGMILHDYACTHMYTLDKVQEKEFNAPIKSMKKIT